MVGRYVEVMAGAPGDLELGFLFGIRNIYEILQYKYFKVSGGHVVLSNTNIF